MNGNIPTYLKDKNLRAQYTSDWKVIKQDRDTGVSLWEFRDWKLSTSECCIMYNNQILIVFYDCNSKSEMEVQSNNAFQTLSIALADGYVLYQP